VRLCTARYSALALEGGALRVLHNPGWPDLGHQRALEFNLTRCNNPVFFNTPLNQQCFDFKTHIRFPGVCMMSGIWRGAVNAG